jgi:anhydro-N-acetylmuramic acid kinase
LEREKSDSQEAVAFAILANETLSGRVCSMPAITGVLRPTVLGEIGLSDGV